MKKIAKKTIILYVLKMLKKGSSEKQPITRKNIANLQQGLILTKKL